MGKGTWHRHREIGVAALLSLSALGIAACSPASDEAAAPVYLMGTVAPDTFGKVSPVMRQSVAVAASDSAAPSESLVGDPVALAPSLTASAAGGKTAVDVIPLDGPPAPAKQPSKAAMLAANPAPMSARFMPAPVLAAPTAEVASAEAAAPKPEAPPAAATPAPIAAPVAPPRPEPSAAELARAEPAPIPAPVPAMTQPVPPVALPAAAAEPARGDIATAGVVISAKDERSARYRPRFYYTP